MSIVHKIVLSILSDCMFCRTARVEVSDWHCLSAHSMCVRVYYILWLQQLIPTELILLIKLWASENLFYWILSFISNWIFCKKILHKICCVKYSVCVPSKQRFLFLKPKRTYLGKPENIVVIRVLFGRWEANVELSHGFSSVTWYKNEILFF